MTHRTELETDPYYSTLHRYILRDWAAAITPEQWIDLATRLTWAILPLRADQLAFLSELNTLQMVAIHRSQMALTEEIERAGKRSQVEESIA